jgi:hypothetical protein
MSLMRPNAKVTIAGRSLSAAEGAIVWLRVDLGLGSAHDGISLQCWPGSQFKSAAPGDEISVALGDKGSEKDVLAGEVLTVQQQPDGPLIDGVSATIALSRLFKTSSHVNPTVADVVRDLIGSAAVDRIDAPLKLGVWHAENRLCVWQQLQTLARLAGADLGSAADGGLRFVSPQPLGAPVRLRHGAQLLDWDLAQSIAPAAPTVAPHGAGSEAGSSRWHWLSHDPVGAAADPARVPGALATRAAAQAVARALSDRATRQGLTGRLLIVGHAALRPGAVVQLVDLPGNNPGKLRVLAVQHRLDRVSGFLTRLTVEGAP